MKFVKFLGGTEADFYEFPHQALLGYNDGDPGEWGCGGSLISPRFVLTGNLFNLHPYIHQHPINSFMSIQILKTNP